jgi:hypothetical protein
MAGSGIAGFLAVAEVIGEVAGNIIDQSQAAMILHRAIDLHMGKVEEVGAGIEADFAAEGERRRRAREAPPAPTPAPAPATPAAPLPAPVPATPPQPTAATTGGPVP